MLSLPYWDHHLSLVIQRETESETSSWRTYLGGREQKRVWRAERSVFELSRRWWEYSDNPKAKLGVVGLETSRTLNAATAFTVAIKFVIVVDHSQQLALDWFNSIFDWGFRLSFIFQVAVLIVVRALFRLSISRLLWGGEQEHLGVRY